MKPRSPCQNDSCVQHRNLNPVSWDNVERFQTRSKTEGLSYAKQRPRLNANIKEKCVHLSKFIGLLVRVFAYLMHICVRLCMI